MRPDLIWLPGEYQLDEAREIRAALKTASDHFPVTISHNRPVFRDADSDVNDMAVRLHGRVDASLLATSILGRVCGKLLDALPTDA